MMFTYLFFVLLICAGKVTKGEIKDTQEVRAIPELSDFAQVVKSAYFVDKTLLIRDLFSEIYDKKDPGNPPKPVPPVKVLASPYFGKTTNQDMIKRFLEIPVDGSGTPIDIEKSSNYKLFKENRLHISALEEIFHDHFGQYAVINVQYKPLSEATDFDHLVELFKEVILNTFLEHKYLLSIESLWTNEFNKTMFEVYFNRDEHVKIHRYCVFCAFSMLAKLLYTHFKKEVFVLIDDCDIAEQSPAYTTGPNKNRIVEFIDVVNNDVFSPENHVKGGVMTATIKKDKTLPSIKTYHKKHVSLKNTELWRYYGLSMEELKQLLKKFYHDEKEIDEVALSISKEYSGIDENTKDKEKSQICSVWFVIRYFEKLRKRLEEVKTE